MATSPSNSTDIKEDIRELQSATGNLSVKIASLDGYLKGAIPNLATKLDLEDKVAECIDKHVKLLHDMKKSSGAISVPPKGSADKKIVAALVATMTILATALSTLVLRIIDTIGGGK